MTPTSPQRANSITQRQLLFASCLVVAALCGAGLMRWFTPVNSTPANDAKVTETLASESPSSISTTASPSTATLPRSQWSAAGIDIQPLSKGTFVETIRLTGKVSLNEDRIAHIYPMVEGSVDRVTVSLGQVVKANDPLIVVHSREVGQAKLELYQARLNHELVMLKDKLQQNIAANTKQLLVALRKLKPILEIEQMFRSKAMGDYRERLLLAYSSFLKSEADLQRIDGIADSGAISTKQIQAAQATRNADQATFQSRIEQIDYEIQTSLLLSSQAVREADTRVAVASTNLRILGCEEKDIESIDPVHQGETISDYPIRAPFDGTVISKDVALKEQVRLSSQVLSIANLDTVWITADIYEQNIPLLGKLAGKQVRVSNEAWPERSFDAKVFFTGEIMDESTRTIAMRAEADNKDHLLKPGMFVTVELNGEPEPPGLLLPMTAVQEHQGSKFVFVHRGDDSFERRPIKMGRNNPQSVEVLSGINEGEPVVIHGGFILKSKMLSELMGEE